MRTLNICANSATCERLWSVYGVTLTKLRNRLGTQTLTSLGELKMHIRDEHIRRDTKKRMKCLFTTRAQAAPSMVPTTTAPPSGPVMGQAAEDAGDVAPTDPEPRTGGGFQELTQAHTQSAAEDETDQAPVTISTIIGSPVPLQRLFDFTDPHWVVRYEKSARLSFDQELELYELLDLDGAGEEDVDVDLDDSTGDLMLG
jgi:hypothetical protein